MRILELLATSFLAHLPFERRDTASSTTATHKSNRGITDLDFVGDVKHLNLCIELLGLSQGGVLFVDHDISTTRHVLFVQTLDVQANIVTGLGLLSPLVVHLDSENLANARVGSSVGWQENHFLTRLHDALLHTPG